MTVKTNHTPGPWDVVPVMVGYAINGHRIYAGDEIVARTHAVDEGYDEANALLISAAPDLLEALKDCADRLRIHMKHSEDLAAHMKAVAAIAKATGAAQ